MFHCPPTWCCCLGFIWVSCFLVLWFTCRSTFFRTSWTFKRADIFTQLASMSSPTNGADRPTVHVSSQFSIPFFPFYYELCHPPSVVSWQISPLLVQHVATLMWTVRSLVSAAGVQPFGWPSGFHSLRCSFLSTLHREVNKGCVTILQVDGARMF